MPGKQHRKKKSGAKAAKRKGAEKKKGSAAVSDEQARKQNPRAFVFNSSGKARIQAARSADKEQRRLHVPVVPGQDAQDPPPFVVLVHGPPGVGKTSIIRALVKHWTRQDVRDIRGPVTVVSGKSRRLTFVECPPDLPGMLDAAKYADLVLLVVDGAFGFEMETFEFLNLLQTAGFPKVMGVLTHLDGFQTPAALKAAKKALKHRFWTEIYQGAKLFYLSGMRHGKYLKREVLNLARFVSIVKFRPLSWRTEHAYLVADRMEDVTPPAVVARNPKVDRTVAVYGYLRGAPWREGLRTHVAGCGDLDVAEVTPLPDPCPMPDRVKRRTLDDKERRIYAPMSDVGGLLFDKDAVYIDVPDWKLAYDQAAGTAGPADAPVRPDDPNADGEAMVRALARVDVGADQRLASEGISLFPGEAAVSRLEGGGPAAGRATESSDESSDEGDDAEDASASDSDSDSGSDSESDSDSDAEAGGRRYRAPRERKAETVRAPDGRTRRRVDFGADHAVPLETAASESESDDESDDDDLVGAFTRRAREARAEREAEESGDEGGDGAASDSSEERLGATAARWKQRIGERVATLFAERGVDLAAAVYGDAAEDKAAAAGGESDSDDELFVRRGSRAAESDAASPSRAAAADDCSREAPDAGATERWSDPEAVESLRNRFVTGDWDAGRARDGARPSEEGDSDDEDGDVYGDFEDLEGGGEGGEGEGDGGAAEAAAAALAQSSDPATRAAARAIRAVEREEKSDASAIASKKAAKKAAFDAAYDEGGVGGEKRAPGGAKDGEDEPDSYFDAMKKDMEERAQRTREALSKLDASTRAALAGHAAGTYVRLELRAVPCELADNFDPRRPLLVGAINPGEDALGYVSARLKRHRWFPRLLKTRDPLIVSVGWRRYQTLPVFAIQDNNGRQRALKYSPEHMHCLAWWWGPRVPPGTGFAAVQRLDNDVPSWRIAATGVTLAHDASTRVVKKLKLVGTPVKIAKRTAFVQGMFTSEIEAAKFEGASVRTVSGIRGTIKRAMRGGQGTGLQAGAVRCTFEDRVLSSDIVFLRAWVSVDVPRYNNPVTNLLAPVVRPKARQPKRGRHRPKDEQRDKATTAKGEEKGEGKGEGKGKGESDAEGATAPLAPEFVPASRFLGARPGAFFAMGARGLGYYRDPKAARSAAGAGVRAEAPAAGEGGAAAAAEAEQEAEQEAVAGWHGMRTTADLRRAKGVSAPRSVDSLYREVERAPRRFNPLKVPKQLQAALPFKSKPKVEAAHKRKLLAQRRAVVLDREEKKRVTLISQLQAIRNARAETRRKAKAKHDAEVAKKQAAEDEWRTKLQKEERKRRYILQGQAEKRAKKGQ